MKITRALRGHNPRTNVESLVTDGLGYCCPFKFFSIYKDNSLIAARLGVSERTVRRYKEALREGRLACTNAPNCLCHRP